jgi:hypothetical protein
MSVRCLSFALVLGFACLLRADGPRQVFIFDGLPRPLWLSEVKLKDVTLDEAVAYLRVQTKLLDTSSRPPSGINLVVKDPLGKIDRKRRISLELNRVTVRDALQALSELLEVKLRIEPYAVVLAPKDDPEPLWTLFIKVPPDFLHMAETLH